MGSNEATVASFIESAPPGELANVVNDIKALASSQPNLLSSLDSAFEKYNQAQYATVTLPGRSEPVIISAHNALGGGRYFDSARQTCFHVDHASHTASGVQPLPHESTHAHLARSILAAVRSSAAEHFPSYSVAVYPLADDSALAILLVANKYSPQNFWNGRWRSTYLLHPPSNTLSGTVKADVHYYEDGNVRMSTSKTPPPSTSRGRLPRRRTRSSRS